MPPNTRSHCLTCAYVHACVCTGVYLCAQVCVCVPVRACTCSPSQTPQAPQSPTAEAQEGACTGPEHPAQKHHPEQIASPGSRPRLLPPARHADPHLHSTLLPAHRMRLWDTTPRTHHAHGACIDHAIHSRAGSWAPLHTYTEKHTHTPALVHSVHTHT